MSLFSKKQSDSKTAHLPANLQTEPAQFKTILETIDDGVILVDDQGAVQLFNPGAAAICAWKPEDAIGINIGSVLELIDDKGAPVAEANNPVNQAFQQGQVIHGHDTILLNHEKQQIPINLRVTPLLNNDKHVTAAVAIFSNVSEQRAEEKQRADFISTASHEMRTPVAAIEGYLALALNEKVASVDERARGYLEKAHASTQHLGQLFQDLLTSAKAEDGRLTSHPAVLEMGAFLEQLSEDFRLIAEKHQLGMDFVVGSTNAVIDASQGQGGAKVVKPLYYVYVDPDRLREVITNLFDNAVKYTPEGKITIGLTGNDTVVQCFVKDTGPGIPSEDVPHLFQKFYRVDNSATRTIGGTGLGLFICRKIVELYNGRIWVESKIGEGSSFYINLPRMTTEKAMEIRSKSTLGENPLYGNATA